MPSPSSNGKKSGPTGPLATSSPIQAADKEKNNKKKKGLSLGGLKSPFKFLGKTYCKGCRKKCSGEVLRVNDCYFHNRCFSCKGCGGSLSQGGFFTKDKDHYCGNCYQSSFGTKCFKCNQYVEGEVVTALGKTYHQNCFKCAGCSNPFPTGERVTFTGKNCLCQKCVLHFNEETTSNEVMTPTTAASKAATTTATPSTTTKTTNGTMDICAGCRQELKDGQALVALDKQYHVWCFKCKACGALLHGEYMGKDGFPYCEKDYQSHFGVKCTYCARFISGKVLQAGDNNHFHPTCARCTKCGDPFGDGEEMFLQGAAIWHPRCGPGPENESGIVVNGITDYSNRDFDDRVSTVSTGMPPYGSRASSPGFRRGGEYDSGRFSRSTTHMPGYGGWRGTLYNSSSTYSLRRPLEPGDMNMGSSSHLNHFHLPASRTNRSSNRFTTRQSMDSIPLMGHSVRPVSAPPKPGYTHIKSHTLPGTRNDGGAISPTGLSDFGDGRGGDAISQNSFRAATAAGDYFRYAPTVKSYQTPPIKAVITNHKIYPYHLIMTTNYKMPPDLDRCNLEKHLNDEDFNMIFDMSRNHFYSLPPWKRNDLKRRARLF